MSGRHKRRCVERPKSIPLTEQSLLGLEQAQPGYRRLERLLDHWFFYLQDTTENFFSTYIGTPDCDFDPLSIEEERSVLSLSQADFQESRVSLPSSVDLFGLTTRSPPPEVHMVIQVARTPSEISWETPSPLRFTSTAVPSTVPETVPSTAVTFTVRPSLELTPTGTSTSEASPRLRQRLSPVRIFVKGKVHTGPCIPHWTIVSPKPSLAEAPEPQSISVSPITASSDPEWYDCQYQIQAENGRRDEV